MKVNKTGFRSFVLLSNIVFLFTACSEKEKKTPNGLVFEIVREGKGETPRPGQYVIFDYSLVDSNDSIWTSTVRDGVPGAYMIADSSRLATENGISQMLRMISEGDSIIIKTDVIELFEKISKRPRPMGVDTTLTLTYHFAISQVLSMDSFRVYREKLIEKFTRKRFDEEVSIIDSVLATQGIQPMVSPSGIRYHLLTERSGPTLTSGQTVLVNYTGRLLDGTYFDTSIETIAKENGLYNSNRKYEPYPVVIDASDVIEGWHEALKQMSKGTKGIFYIPSSLAYGPQGRGNVIRGNSILVFEMEVLNTD